MGVNGLGDDDLRVDLQDLRHALLHLHKTLLDSERTAYNQDHVPIGSTGEFFQLVLSDPWFAWLRPMSGLIALIDDRLDTEEALVPDDVRGFRDQVRSMLRPSEEEPGLGSRYNEALQREAENVVAHAAVMKILARELPEQGGVHK
jgi:hypothetical protein